MAANEKNLLRILAKSFRPALFDKQTIISIASTIFGKYLGHRRFMVNDRFYVADVLMLGEMWENELLTPKALLAGLHEIDPEDTLLQQMIVTIQTGWFERLERTLRAQQLKLSIPTNRVKERLDYLSLLLDVMETFSVAQQSVLMQYKDVSGYNFIFHFIDINHPPLVDKLFSMIIARPDADRMQILDNMAGLRAIYGGHYLFSLAYLQAIASLPHGFQYQILTNNQINNIIMIAIRGYWESKSKSKPTDRVIHALLSLIDNWPDITFKTVKESLWCYLDHKKRSPLTLAGGGSELVPTLLSFVQRLPTSVILEILKHNTHLTGLARPNAYFQPYGNIIQYYISSYSTLFGLEKPMNNLNALIGVLFELSRRGEKTFWSLFTELNSKKSDAIQLIADKGPAVIMLFMQFMLHCLTIDEQVVVIFLTHFWLWDEMARESLKLLARLSPASKVAFFQQVDSNGDGILKQSIVYLNPQRAADYLNLFRHLPAADKVRILLEQEQYKPGILFAACENPNMFPLIFKVIEELPSDDRAVILKQVDDLRHNVFHYAAIIGTECLEPLLSFLFREDLNVLLVAQSILTQKSSDGRNIIHFGRGLNGNGMQLIIDALERVGKEPLLQDMLQQHCCKYKRNVIMGAAPDALTILLKTLDRLQLNKQEFLLQCNELGDTALIVAAKKNPTSIPILLDAMKSWDLLLAFDYLNHCNKAGDTAMSIMCQHWNGHEEKTKLLEAKNEIQEKIKQRMNAPSSSNEPRFFISREGSSLRRCSSEPSLGVKLNG